MSKTSVILKTGWPGTFHRTVRDSEGRIIKDKAGNPRVLAFSPGEVVELDPVEIEAVRDDVGKALFIAKIDKDSKPVPKLDHELTAKFVKETAELRDKKAEAKEKKAAATSAHKDLEHKDKK